MLPRFASYLALCLPQMHVLAILDRKLGSKLPMQPFEENAALRQTLLQQQLQPD